MILANAGAVSLTQTWAIGGTPTDVGDVTIGVVDGNGDTVVASGTATTNNSDGTYTYSLADQANPNELTVTWTDDDSGDTRVNRIEVVGSWLFTETQARTFSAKADANSANIPLASDDEYPDATIADERIRITNDLEYWTGRSWVERYARIEINGNGGTVLDVRNGLCRLSTGAPLHRPARSQDISRILSASIGGTTVAVGDISVGRDGKILHETSSWTTGTQEDPFNVVIEYAYGLPYIVDGVDRIALKLLVDRLVPSVFPDRALSIDTDFGNTRIVQPGGPMNNVSRIPEVNEWVNRHDHRIFTD